MTEITFAFRGLSAAQGYRAYIPGVLFHGSVEVVAEKNDEGKVGISGRMSPPISTGFEAARLLARPFNITVLAYNALEGQDYKMEIVGVELELGKRKPFAFCSFIARAIIPWKPSPFLAARVFGEGLNPSDQAEALSALEGETS